MNAGPEANAIRRELFDQKRFREALGNPRSLEMQGSERYPRIVGDADDGAHVAVLVKYTGHLNANRFRNWLTVSPKEWQAVLTPPAGYRYFVAQVGRLPNNELWWIALFNMAAVLEANIRLVQKENRPIIESVQLAAGSFYRINPATLPEYAKPVTIDLQVLTMDQLEELTASEDVADMEEAHTAVDLEMDRDIADGALALLERIDADLPDLPIDEQKRIDQRMLRIRQRTRARLEEHEMAEAATR